MSLSIIERPATDEHLAAATYPGCKGEFVTLAERRRNARRTVRLYRDRDGRPFIRDKWTGKRYIEKIRFLTIDGEPVNCGSAVLEPPPCVVPLDHFFPTDPTGENIAPELLA